MVMKSMHIDCSSLSLKYFENSAKNIFEIFNQQSFLNKFVKTIHAKSVTAN